MHLPHHGAQMFFHRTSTTNKIRQFFSAESIHRPEHNFIIFSFRQLANTHNYFVVSWDSVCFPHIKIRVFFRCRFQANSLHIFHISANREFFCPRIIFLINHQKFIRISRIMLFCHIIFPIRNRCALIKMKAMCGINNRNFSSCHFVYFLCRFACENSCHRHMAVNQIKFFLKHQFFQRQIARPHIPGKWRASKRNMMSVDSRAHQPGIVFSIHNNIKVCRIMNFISHFL